MPLSFYWLRGCKTFPPPRHHLTIFSQEALQRMCWMKIVCNQIGVIRWVAGKVKVERHSLVLRKFVHIPKRTKKTGLPSIITRTVCKIMFILDIETWHTKLIALNHVRYRLRIGIWSMEVISASKTPLRTICAKKYSCIVHIVEFNFWRYRLATSDIGLESPSFPWQ